MLKGFERVNMEPGEAKTVRFVLGKDHLSLWNQRMQHVVEPGTFTVMVGPNSVDVLSTQFEMT
jgi:beta-glucosidase